MKRIAKGEKMNDYKIIYPRINEFFSILNALSEGKNIVKIPGEVESLSKEFTVFRNLYFQLKKGIRIDYLLVSKQGVFTIKVFKDDLRLYFCVNDIFYDGEEIQKSLNRSNVITEILETHGMKNIPVYSILCFEKSNISCSLSDIEISMKKAELPNNITFFNSSNLRDVIESCCEIELNQETVEQIKDTIKEVQLHEMLCE